MQLLRYCSQINGFVAHRSQCCFSRFLDLLGSWLGTLVLAGRHCLCWSFPFVMRWDTMPRERREAALLSWATSRIGMLRKVIVDVL